MLLLLIINCELLLKTFIRKLYDQGYGIVLLLDDYEYLMEYTFDKQTGAFFFIRDLTSGFPRYPDKPHPLTYIVAGALPWNKLSDDVAGSPDLNKVTAEPREKGEQPETPVDKPTQDAIFRATLQAIPPNA